MFVYILCNTELKRAWQVCPWVEEQFCFSKQTLGFFWTHLFSNLCPSTCSLCWGFVAQQLEPSSLSASWFNSLREQLYIRLWHHKVCHNSCIFSYIINIMNLLPIYFHLNKVKQKVIFPFKEAFKVRVDEHYFTFKPFCWMSLWFFWE